MKKVILLDGNAIVHRAFHALPPLTSPDGTPTNAVYGFVSILLKIISELKPDYILATFDLAGPTFRHLAFERYKATRVKQPDELYAQFPVVKEILSALHIPIYEKEGYEADDIIGTAARVLEKKNKNLEIVIVTGDLDTLQLVTKRTKVFTMRKGITDTVLYDEKAVFDRYGFPPARVADYKGLRGDPSDNIPGVKGIGEKTAQKLIQKFGSLEEIYKHIKSIAPEGLKKKLEQEKEEAFFSKELATINTNVPVNIEIEAARWQDTIKTNAKLQALFERLGFFSLLRRLTMDDSSGVRPSSPDQPVHQKNVNSGGGREEIDAASAAENLLRAIKKRGHLNIALFPGDESGGLFAEKSDCLFCAIEDGGTVYRIGGFAQTLPILKEAFEDPAIYKRAFDSKKAGLFLRARGIVLNGVSFDVILAKYLLSAHERMYDPAGIMQEYGIKQTAPENSVRHLAFLERAMSAKLAELKLLDVFKKIELPLTPVLVEMEYRGVAMDKTLLQRLSSEISHRLEKLSQKIYEHAGETFNINSPAQVSAVLFKKLSLRHKGLRKTGGGAESTRASELEKLKGAHPIIDCMLEYRELQKLKSTYIDVLPALISPEDGRIHTTYNQTGTVTGRLSSSNPNLQNIPTRTELGKKIQSAFIPSEGFLLCAFDYSQMQLRIAAHMSGDQKLIEAFRRGADIHTMTAAEINNIPVNRVTPEMRREAKTLNFGVLYGMGARAFAESAGISREKAKQFIDEYFDDFSGLRAFLDSLKDHARRFGYVETLFGRRRYIPELKSPSILMRLEGERMAINMPIQGTEADMMKLAMIKIYETIIRKNLSEEVRPILQVHDELIFEIKIGKENFYVPRIKEIMEQVVELSVPVIVDVRVGKNWGELKG